MAVRIQVPKKAALVRFVLHPWGRAFLIGFVAINTLLLALFTYSYVRYSRQIDEKLLGGPFTNTSMLFAAPQVVMVGDQLTADEIAVALRRSGYSDTKTTSRMGWYNMRPDAIEIFPGTESYFNDEEAVVKFKNSKVSQVISLRDNTERTQYLIEPELITNLFDRSREKRRIVRFPDLPKMLINAVVSAEDKRFFQHSGFDPLRVLKAAYVDLKEQRRAQGASTLSMQLARSFWLTPEKTAQRKIAEVMITLHLEQKLSKEQIFEYYGNMVDWGAAVASRFAGSARQRRRTSEKTFGISAGGGRHSGRLDSTPELHESGAMAGTREVTAKRCVDVDARERLHFRRRIREGRRRAARRRQERVRKHGRPLFCRLGQRFPSGAVSGARFPEQLVSRLHDAGSQSATRRGRSCSHRNEGRGRPDPEANEERPAVQGTASRHGRDGPDHRGYQGVDRRPGLRAQSVESCRVEASAGVCFQAVRLCRRLEFGRWRGLNPRHAGYHNPGRTDHVSLRRSNVPAQ